MIFRRNREDDFDDEEEELEQVLFQGALNGNDPNLAKHARLAHVALVPTKQLISEALIRRAEKMVLEPKGPGSLVTMYIDGIPFRGSRLSKQHSAAMTQMLKVLGGMEPGQSQKPQRGGVKAEFQDQPYELRITTVPVPGGAERLMIDAKNLKTAPGKPEELGIDDELKERIRELTGRKKGLIIVCGSKGSGLTTSTRGVVRSVDAYIFGVFNIADLDGEELPYVTDFEIRDDDLPTVFQRLVRSEADVVFTDPIRSEETAKLLLKVQEDLAIIAEMPIRDASTGIAQLVKAAGAEAVLEGLSASMGVKLIRLLCHKCKEAFRANPKILAKVGLPRDTKLLYRPFSGEMLEEDEEEPPICEECGGLGYKGRIGLFEMIEITGAVAEAIKRGGGPNEIRKAAASERMPTFRTAGLKLVAEGRTSLEELQRVFKPAR